MKVILHDIRSAHNVGSVFRTADGSGVEKIYLSGYTPSPVDRFGRDRKNIAKVALGAENLVPWERSPDIFSLFKDLKKEGSRILALEQSSQSRDYRDVSFLENDVIVAGNEVDGLPKEVIDKSDLVIEIPMRGAKTSLNVSVAVAIMLFAASKER